MFFSVAKLPSTAIHNAVPWPDPAPRGNPNVSPQGLARDLLLTIVSGPHVLIFSSAILVEVQRALTYPHVQARWPLTGEAIEQHLVFLEAAGVLVELPEVSPAIISDPDDDPILQTAIVGRAELLCTRDEIPDDINLLHELRP
jgi:putative PIN family toxin of toxin-antitoxin system